MCVQLFCGCVTALSSVSCAAVTRATAGGRRTDGDRDSTEPDGTQRSRFCCKAGVDDVAQLLTAGCLLVTGGPDSTKGWTSSAATAPLSTLRLTWLLTGNWPSTPTPVRQPSTRASTCQDRVGHHAQPALTELLILVLIHWSRRCVCVLQVFVSSCSTWGRTEPQERWGRGRGSAPCCPCRAFIRESPHTSTSRCATNATPHHTSDPPSNTVDNLHYQRGFSLNVGGKL